ncbi:copper resistance CopC/CopD family protein [Streptomyces sp. NPDC050560]|uniref:copper resistance CopC/CopD family protein n=1 Tax=Streptomyces sp. NPDC050560 TaxID=3365630 RepID=UPI00378BEC1C
MLAALAVRPRSVPRWAHALAAVALGVFGILLSGAAPASAHAALLGTDPKQGAVVETAPAQVSLTFSEEVTMADDSVRVLDPRGTRVEDGRATGAGHDTYRVRLRPGLGRGTYTVAYQVVSADSHPVSGAFTFSVGAPSATAAAVPDQDTGGGVVGFLYNTARYFSYAGFVLLVGGGTFVLACWRRGAGARPLQRLVVSGWVVITAATLALLLMRGSYTKSGKVADIFDLGLLGDVLETKPGAALVSRLLLLAVAALFIAVLFGTYARRVEAEEAGGGGDAGDAADGSRDLRFGLAVGGAVIAVGVAATWALSEHASVGMQTLLAMPVDIVHLLAVAVWLGGLSALLTALYRLPSLESAAVRRFSALAFGSVVTLVASGLYQTWRQVGSWSALTGTSFGQLLLAKVGLVVVIVAVAAGSRRWTGRLAEAPARAAARKGGARGGAAKAGGKRAGKAAAKVPGQKAKAGAAAGSGSSGRKATGGGGGTAAGGATGGGSKGGASGGGGSGKGGAAKNSASKDGASGDGAGGDVRAAQLARQRAAEDAAARKRERDADPARARLRRSVLAEAVVALALLGVTTVLTTTEPGRTVEEVAHSTAGDGGTQGAGGGQQPAAPVALHEPYDTGGKNGQGMVMLGLDPSRPGRNDVDITVMDLHGKPIDIPEVTVALTLKAQHIGPLRITPKHLSTGKWAAKGTQIPMAGQWEIAVTVRTSDIDEVTIRKNAQIG